MTVKELCEMLPDSTMVKIATIETCDDMKALANEPVLVECLGDYELSSIRPTAQDEIIVFLKTQYVKRNR